MIIWVLKIFFVYFFCSLDGFISVAISPGSLVLSSTCSNLLLKTSSDFCFSHCDFQFQKFGLTPFNNCICWYSQFAYIVVFDFLWFFSMVFYKSLSIFKIVYLMFLTNISFHCLGFLRNGFCQVLTFLWIDFSFVWFVIFLVFLRAGHSEYYMFTLKICFFPL